jgi:hypothetical protein
MEVTIDTITYPNHTSIILCYGEDDRKNRIEIHGDTRKEIVIAAINQHHAVMGTWNGSPSWKITVDDAPGKRLLYLLTAMQKSKHPVRRDEAHADLVKNFSIEKLEKFLGIRALLE